MSSDVDDDDEEFSYQYSNDDEFDENEERGMDVGGSGTEGLVEEVVEENYGMEVLEENNVVVETTETERTSQGQDAIIAEPRNLLERYGVTKVC